MNNTSEYLLKKLFESGIDFSKITKKELLMTSKKYDGIISNENFCAIIDAVNNIYGEVTVFENN